MARSKKDGLPSNWFLDRNGNKRYRFKVKVGKKKIEDTGKWVSEYKEFTGRTKKEAENKYKKYINKQGAGGQCLGELVDSWIDNSFSIDERFSDRTKARYINAYRFAFEGSSLLGQDLSEITGAMLQKEYNSMSCGASTVKAAHKLLRLFFKWCEREGVSQDLTRSIITPRVQQKRRTQEIEILSGQEISRILDGFEGHRLRLLIVLAYKTGARISELLALRYDDITKDGVRINKQLEYVNRTIRSQQDEEGERFKITKTKTAAAVRVVPISDSTRDEINLHRVRHKKEMTERGYNTPYIFTTKTGRFYDDSVVRTACNRVYDKIGVRRVGFHVYRHTFGSTMANRGVPIQAVAALMGHSDISVTSKYYINVSENVKRQAIEKLERKHITKRRAVMLNNTITKPIRRLGRKYQ